MYSELVLTGMEMMLCCLEQVFVKIMYAGIQTFYKLGWKQY